MKTTRAKIASNLIYAIGKTLSLVGVIGRRVVREISNRPRYRVEIVNTNTGEIMHKANNVSASELTKILDAMRTLKGPLESVITTIK